MSLEDAAASSCKRSFSAGDVAIVIPTYGRDQVLLDTIACCLDEPDPPGQVIVIDQLPQHDQATTQQLEEWAAEGRIVWDCPTRASQPAAMNRALAFTALPLVLFLDDDVVPSQGFVGAHARAHADPAVWVVVGQIIQPWQTPAAIPKPVSRDTLRADFDFPFHSTQPADLANVMSGHMSVRTDRVRELGGFDENFHGAAYRFDTEFGRRVLRAGGKILFEPRASLKHLRAERGGTRQQGNHLASANPIHGVGDYYFALLQGVNGESLRYMGKRLFREVCTKFHLRHPWCIPVKFVGELRALAWACQLKRTGQKLLPPAEAATQRDVAAGQTV